MRRLLVGAMVLGLAALLGGDGIARADGLPQGDPPLVERGAEAGACCGQGSGYRGRTQFVVEMLRSVEAL